MEATRLGHLCHGTDRRTDREGIIIQSNGKHTENVAALNLDVIGESTPCADALHIYSECHHSHAHRGVKTLLFKFTDS